ncbi:GID complex subunit containing RING finger motif [Myotisia sp. PD_48]|nr:GID complex subunit containing RING finger motif [Myotisia sp. PD_48]
MAAELTSIKLNHESHLILDQPLLRLPHELARRNFKSVQRIVEREKDHVLPLLKQTANASLAGTQDPTQVLGSLDSMITRMQGLKRKMETLQEEERRVLTQSRKRIEHLEDLFRIPSLADVKYDEWSRIRLDRLLVDHMLRSGYLESAKQLAEEKGIQDLVDVTVFAQCRRIAESLRRGESKEALQWCGENKVALKKAQNKLEFDLRMQQYIEMLRAGEKTAARQHARKYLTPHSDMHKDDILRAAGLLVFEPGTEYGPYKTMYSLDRWQQLANLFIRTHHDLLALSSHPLLQIALSAGLSALKTPACHSEHSSSGSGPIHSAGTSICPICSTELNELAREMPYAHHTKSSVENDPVVLPNNRVYGRTRLLDLSRRAGVSATDVRDPITGEEFPLYSLKKVFIS